MIQATAANTTATDVISSGEWSDIKKLVVDVADGKSILSITEYYARSKVNNTAPSSWSTTVPTLTTSYKYLWNYELITYSTMDSQDPTKHETQETAKRVIGVYGNTGTAGKGISSIANYYLATADGSGVTKSTSGWTDTVQSMTATNKYLWNYELITYTDSTTSESDPTIIGVYGDTGKGISSVQEQYYLSTSKTSASGGSWQTTQPEWSNGKYIWTRSKITWSDGSISYTTAICANAINGANESVQKLDDMLDQDEVFRRLTNGFNNDGVYLENGRLFINSTGIATGFIHDKATINGTNIEFFNEIKTMATRDYESGVYISAANAACRTTKNVYKNEWLNVVSTKKVNRIATVYSEESNIATRDYVTDDYITFGGNLYRALATIHSGDTLSSSGLKNCNLIGTCYTETGYYATRAYSVGAYIDLNTNLYQVLTALASGDLMYPGANVTLLDLPTTYKNYWNLNTGYFQTQSGKIGGFTIADGTTATLDSSYSDLYYISSGRTWATPYSDVNTPITGVGLRGSEENSASLGYNILSQGRMFLNGSATNYAGRIRIFAGMIYFDVGLYPGQGTNTSYNKWTQVAWINPFVNSSNINNRGLYVSSNFSLGGTLGSEYVYNGQTCLYVSGNVFVSGAAIVAGGKNREVETESYGKRLLYSYETPTPMFGDVGEGEIGEDGLCYIWLDPIFAQTIEKIQYQVFLQKYSAGDCYIHERKSEYFVVQGTPGLQFGWELKAKQAGLSTARLNQFAFTENLPNTDKFSEEANAYLSNLREGRITE